MVGGRCGGGDDDGYKEEGESGGEEGQEGQEASAQARGGGDGARISP